MTEPSLLYDCDRSRLSEALRPKFIELSIDAELREYLHAAQARRHGVLLTSVHRGLRRLMSDFDVNGLLGACCG